jgi:hypothetical protein
MAGFLSGKHKMPNAKDFQNVAVPKSHVEKLRQLARLDQRSMAREISWLIDEAYSQLVEPKTR